MDFIISRDEGIVSIDNQPLAIDTSPVPANVAMVVYDCSGGTGNLEYNDRLRLLEPFIDLTPYTPFVNAWITQASALAFPITLAQAKTVKIGLVDGIFNSKRQLPITYQGNNWDATDSSLMGMQAAITSWDVAAAVTQADAEFANNVNAIQPVVTRITDVAASAITPTTDTIPNIFLVPVDGQHDTIAEGAWQSAGPGVTGVTGGGVTQQPNVTMTKSPIQQQTPVQGPPIDWPPLNSTLMVRLTMAQMRELIWDIQWRRTQLQTNRLIKTQAINAKTNLADVIAYDVTTGWDIATSPPPPSGVITGGGVTGGGGPTGGPTFTTRADATDGLLVDSSGWGDFTIVTVIDQSVIHPLDGGNSVRVTLAGHFSFSSCYIGPRAASHPGGFEMASTRQLLFSGRANATVAGTMFSDALNINLDGTNGVVVRFHIVSGGANPQRGNKLGWVSYYVQGDFAGSTGAIGWSPSAPYFFAACKLESSYA